MSEHAIMQTIRRSRRRVLVGRLVGWLADVLAFGLLALVAFGTLAESAGLGPGAWAGFFAGLAAIVLAHGARELSRGTSLAAVAQRLDRELGFHDRISSALAFSRRERPTGFMLAQLQETAAFLERNRDRAVCVPWPARGRALVLFVAVGLMSLLPHSDRALLEARDRREQQAGRRQAARDLVRELDQLRRRADMAGLSRLGQVVADARQALVEKIDLVEPEDLVPPPEEPPADSDLPVSKSRDSAPEGDSRQGTAAAAAAATAGAGVRLSQVAAYQPVGKFDSFPAQTYAGVFAELDGVVIGNEELTARDLANLAKHVDLAAEKFNTFGFDDDLRAFGLEGGMRNQGGEAMLETGEYSPFTRNLAPLQTRAFSEFLKRYSDHLGEKALGRAHLEQTRQRSGDGGEVGEVINLSAPPPKDAKFAVRGVTDSPGQAPRLEGTPEQLAQVAGQALASGEITGADGSPDGLKVSGAGTAPGGKGAGSGGSDGSGLAAPKILPRASGGEYLPLEGKLSDGQSVVRLIDAQGRRTLGPRGASRDAGELSYREVFVEYARGAEAELNSEDVPLHMRDYIREYFRSIRPQAD